MTRKIHPEDARVFIEGNLTSHGIFGREVIVKAKHEFPTLKKELESLIHTEEAMAARIRARGVGGSIQSGGVVDGLDVARFLAQAAGVTYAQAYGRGTEFRCIIAAMMQAATCPAHGRRPGDPVAPVVCNGQSLACALVAKYGEVFRDPAVKGEESWRVKFDGKICTPSFNSKGAAAAYLDGLRRGERKPEFANTP